MWSAALTSRNPKQQCTASLARLAKLKSHVLLKRHTRHTIPQFPATPVIQLNAYMRVDPHRWFQVKYIVELATERLAERALAGADVACIKSTMLRQPPFPLHQCARRARTLYNDHLAPC